MRQRLGRGAAQGYTPLPGVMHQGGYRQGRGGVPGVVPGRPGHCLSPWESLVVPGVMTPTTRAQPSAPGEPAQGGRRRGGIFRVQPFVTGNAEENYHREYVEERLQLQAPASEQLPGYREPQSPPRRRPAWGLSVAAWPLRRLCVSGPQRICMQLTHLR